MQSDENFKHPDLLSKPDLKIDYKVDREKKIVFVTC